jgi:hypothetical protein
LWGKRHLLQPGVQILEVLLQVLAVLLLRDSIHAHRRVLPAAVIGSLQGTHIDPMRQRVEPSFGLALRSFHYPQQLR